MQIFYFYFTSYTYRFPYSDNIKCRYKNVKERIFSDDSDRNLLSGFDWGLCVMYSTILQTTRNLNARGHFNGLVTMQELHTESWRPTLNASKDLRRD